MKRHRMIALFGIFAATLISLLGIQQSLSHTGTHSILSQQAPPCNPDYDRTCQPG